ncbi:MAG: amidophosphoribosyltransferase [Dehalococcoidia bacterium]|nr:amidophosphoribosyltransferase [Dehalococcoidia bacterium]MDP7089667.1 amidophosphoribosyltransferase [Dehalococcoidia bacterium]MDP7261060.1 amidophosphoribosyltransferase [Dehalococcoidia bacterium]
MIDTQGPIIPKSDDKPHEACGIIGAYLPDESVVRTAFFGLFALQHRGQESAGIATSDGDRIHLKAQMGLVSQVFREETLAALPGHVGIGHTRYSTMGGSKDYNAQPLLADGQRGSIAVGHNGNVINARELRIEMAEEFGSSFEKTSDTEVIAELFAKAPGADWFEVSAYAMRRLKGAYSLTILTKDKLVAVRDPLGIRPLCLGTLNGGWVVASETAALDNIGADFVRELENGETLIIDENGVESRIWSGARDTHAMCVFEQIYFARPDSLLNGELAYETRQRLGAEVYREHPVDADIVVGIPDSSTPHAVGVAAAAKIPYTEAIIRNRYVGRTFIQPDQRSRAQGVQAKFNPMRGVIEGKRLLVVDDSIVRSTTITRVVKMLRWAGAKEVHVRVASPPIKSTCHFGVDMATMGELIAANKTIEEIAEFIDADSLAYLSVQGLLRAVRAPENAYCTGCFTGDYPIPVQLEMNKMGFEVAPAD